LVERASRDAVWCSDLSVELLIDGYEIKEWQGIKQVGDEWKGMGLFVKEKKTMTTT